MHSPKPNAVVAQIHAKAMPVILTEDYELETWLKADWSVAKELQRSLPDGLLQSAPLKIGYTTPPPSPWVMYTRK